MSSSQTGESPTRYPNWLCLVIGIFLFTKNPVNAKLYSTSGKLESWRTTTGGSLNRLDDPRHALLMLLALSFLHLSLTLQSYNLCFSLLLDYQWPNFVRWLLKEVLLKWLAYDKSCFSKKNNKSQFDCFILDGTLGKVKKTVWINLPPFDPQNQNQLQ